MPFPHPLHLPPLMRAQPPRPLPIPPKLLLLTLLLHHITPINPKPPNLHDERRVAPVRLHPPALRRPVVRVPHRRVYFHGLVGRVRVRVSPGEDADGNVVHEEAEVGAGPQEGVGVEGGGGVEPEGVALVSGCPCR